MAAEKLPPWQLRVATVADLPQLAALYADTAARMGPLVYTSEQVAAWVSFAVVGPVFADYVLGATTWVAQEGDGVLGFCGIDGKGEVRSLYVRVGHTRQGLGSALLCHALAEERRSGRTRFNAWATPFSVPVFERAGFRLAERVQAPYQGVMFERYRMVLD